MSHRRNHLKHWLHMFLKKPGFTIAALAALALGVETNTDHSVGIVLGEIAGHRAS